MYVYVCRKEDYWREIDFINFHPNKFVCLHATYSYIHTAIVLHTYRVSTYFSNSIAKPFDLQ